jgi:hypothetical protein
MIGAAGFDQGDAAGQGGALAGGDAPGEVLDVGGGTAQMRTAVPETLTISIEPLAPTVS